MPRRLGQGLRANLSPLVLRDGLPVSIVHMQTAHKTRISAFRQATRREAGIFSADIKN